MPLNIPVDFEQVKGSGGGGGGKGQYPNVIKASDLMKNFTYCALDVDDTLLSNNTGSGGYGGRMLNAIGKQLQYVESNSAKTGTFWVTNSQGG